MWSSGNNLKQDSHEAQMLEATLQYSVSVCRNLVITEGLWEQYYWDIAKQAADGCGQRFSCVLPLSVDGCKASKLCSIVWKLAGLLLLCTQ